MKIVQVISCDGCGAEWCYKENGRRKIACPECRVIWHKAGQTFEGLRFTVAR